MRPRKKVGTSTYGHGEHRDGERPQRSFSNNSGERRSYGDRPRRSYGDRPQRSFGDRPQRRDFEGGSNEGRSSRPQRSFGDRPQHRNYDGNGSSEHRSYGDRPQRSYGDRPQRSFGDRPQRSFGDRPQRRNFEGGAGEERRPYGNSRPQRRNFGGKPGFNNNGRNNFHKRFEPKFNDHDEEGINQMISRKPQLDSMQYSDNDRVLPAMPDEVRLNKFIANSGVCSRREADTFIQAGVVTVNGEVVTELGTKVNIYTDDVRFNGERLKGEEKVYIVMNKPKGFVTTASDPHAEKTVMDLLKGCTIRVFPVGRLDKATTGVLMFTNDGEIAERLTHPSYDKKKIYQVILDHALDQADYDKILEGITLNDGLVKADELEYIDANDKRKLGIEIHSGKNRIVRRIFESLGYDVKALDRVYFAGLTKKGLQKGEWRYLSEGEVNILRMGAYV